VCVEGYELLVVIMQFCVVILLLMIDYTIDDTSTSGQSELNQLLRERGFRSIAKNGLANTAFI
jgi:hypothetical protein